MVQENKTPKRQQQSAMSDLKQQSASTIVKMEPQKASSSAFIKAETKFTKRKRRIYSYIKKNLYYIPLILSITIFLNLVLPYLISIHYKRVDPILPFVSDGGALSPAASIFSLFLDLNSCLVIVMCFVRYKQLKHCLKQLQMTCSKIDQQNQKLFERLSFLNWTSLMVLISGAIGGFGTASFRMTESYILHFLSAGMLFVNTNLYFIMMCYITWKMYLNFGFESPPITMTIVTIINAITMFGFLGFFALTLFAVGPEKYFDHDFRLHWPMDHDAYIFHLLNTSSEWICLLCLPIMLLCLFKRMRRFDQWDSLQYFV